MGEGTSDCHDGGSVKSAGAGLSLAALAVPAGATELLTRGALGKVAGAHAVISGKIVGAPTGTPTTLTVERTTTIPLGAGGGNQPFEEPSLATIVTDDDGSFAWHLPPSTTPNALERFLAGEGEKEARTLRAGEHDLDIVVDRGQTIDVRITPAGIKLAED